MVWSGEEEEEDTFEEVEGKLDGSMGEARAIGTGRGEESVGLGEARGDQR